MSDEVVNEFVIKGKDAHGTGYFTDDGFVVKAGSIARKKIVPSHRVEQQLFCRTERAHCIIASTVPKLHPDKTESTGCDRRRSAGVTLCGLRHDRKLLPACQGGGRLLGLLRLCLGPATPYHPIGWCD